MTAFDEYRRTLQDLGDVQPFLLERSGLPGPRGNIELAQAMAEVGTRKQFDRFVSFTPDRAPVGCRGRSSWRSAPPSDSAGSRRKGTEE
jgi:hypothetical protein